MPLREFLAGFRPIALNVDARERLRAVVGSGVGVLLTALISLAWAGESGLVWLVAPVGASAVLVFALPSSPLAQPWAVVGGTSLSALVGAVCAMLIADPSLAGAVAVAVAIALMFLLRCLHPPGGAAALLAALGGVSVSFVLFPVLVNTVLLVIAGMVYNSVTGRRYPHPQSPAKPASESERFSAADLDAALAHFNGVVDISRDDLGTLLNYAEAAAYERRFNDLRCADIMSGSVLTAQFGTPLNEAWNTMRQARIKALPVVDRGNHIVGIVTVADFMRHAGLDKREGIALRLKRLMTPSGLMHSEKPEVIGQIMTRSVRVASSDRRISELIPLFSEGGHHHLPIIDEARKLVGIITQTDLVKALYKETRPANPR